MASSNSSDTRSRRPSRPRLGRTTTNTSGRQEGDPNTDRLYFAHFPRPGRGGCVLRALHPGACHPHHDLGIDVTGHALEVLQGGLGESKLINRLIGVSFLSVAWFFSSGCSEPRIRSLTRYGIEESHLGGRGERTLAHQGFRESYGSSPRSCFEASRLQSPLRSSAKGTGTVKNLMNSGVEIPVVGTKVSTRYS